MPTESEAKIARYNTIEREADDWGRIIGVRRLRPSERMNITGFVSNVSGFDEFTDPRTGEISRFPRSASMFIVAAVCEIDGAPIPLARSRGELDAMLDRLDDEGRNAAIIALGRLVDVDVKQPLDEAKNLSGTPPSA
jgi:hypothetical protein